MLYESKYYGVVRMDDFVEHHGIKGQKWGIRRYQNPDGTLTEEGRKRYLTSYGGLTKAGKRNYRKAVDKALKTYKINEYAEKLRPYLEKRKAAADEVSAYSNSITDRLIKSAGSKKFESLFETRMKAEFESDDDDDKKELEDFKKVVRDEYKSALANGSNIKSTYAYDLAKRQAFINDKTYDRLWSKFTSAEINYNKAAKDLSNDTYKKNGSDAARRASEAYPTDIEAVRKITNKSDDEIHRDWLEYEIRDACEKKYKH